MRRREVIALLGGAATWPLAARAQQREQMRRIGVLMNLGSDDAEGQARNAAFLQGLQELGWTAGRNVQSMPRQDRGTVTPTDCAARRLASWQSRSTSDWVHLLANTFGAS